MLNQDTGTSLESEFGEAAEDTENEVDPDAGGSSIFGSPIAVLDLGLSIFWLVVFFPGALESLGAPSWFATAIGRGFQMLILLGIAQIVRGTEIL